MTTNRTNLEKNNSDLLNVKKLPSYVDGKTLLEQMKRYPYYGFIDVQLPGAKDQFVMFSSNDCAVSGKLFWTNEFCYEPGSINLWRRLSVNSKVIVDSGAYTGLYSLVSAFVNSKAKIYSFEPVSFIRARLSMNSIVNKFSNIKIFPCALSNQSSTIELHLPFGPEIFTSGTSIVSDKKTETRELASISAYDDLGLYAPDLIKIDAEGAEHLVLQGMTRSFINNPFLLCEILGNKEPGTLLDYLPLDYSFYYIKERGVMVLTNDRDEWRKSGGLNVIYYHKSKISFFNNLLISSINEI
jgi:FkbM family methyltransferase